ncbi:MAG TPA: hypothetical protein VFZ00_28045 [Solirubrobacter sp.]|nr:hypothetical protein [Solirubrobacter sp.]
MEEPAARFKPLRPASRARLVAAIVLGPITWFALFTLTSLVLRYTDAIALGLLVATLSFMGGVIVLSLLRWGRHREERRFADPG